ncbi:MAG TPA: TerB family tellurite resistance protein [Polyangiaceae bacterium]
MLRWLTDKLGLVAPSPLATKLEEAVRANLPGVDEATTKLVVAVAGLLGTVAYADRDYSDAEERRIRAELGRVSGLAEKGIGAICAVLRQHIVTVATIEAPTYARELRELGDRELRLEVLGALVDLAAADDDISVAETNVLRALVPALGLSQADYNAAQSRHRDKLSVLKK